jgi:hypothetical protein
LSWLGVVFGGDYSGNNFAVTTASLAVFRRKVCQQAAKAVQVFTVPRVAFVHLVHDPANVLKFQVSVHVSLLF